MSRVIEIDFHPDDRTLRQFGFIALGGFGFVAALAWFEVLIFAFGLGAARVPVAAGCLGLGVLAALFSLVWPRANWPIFVGLSLLTFPIGFVLSYVLLGILFYGIIAPAGMLLRLFGKDPMERRILPEAETYWVDAGPPRASESYFKQF